MIASCGEALVDFVPAGGGPGSWHELLGGSPYNIARGLGRLGTPCAFVGAVSKDMFGEELVRGLEEAGVDLAEVQRSSRPTTLSFVGGLDTGGPSYAFYSAEAADRHFASEDPATLAGQFSALHFGSNSLALEPGAQAFEALARAAAASRLVSLDPNVRPRLIADPRLVADRDGYLERVRRIIGLCTVLKLSDEDLSVLEPGARGLPPGEVAAELLRSGPALVVLTRGSDGATAWTATATVTVPALPVRVVDTIGAGDGFMAAILAFLAEHDLLGRPAVEAMDTAILTAMLECAARVAATVCTRRGADMPARDELVDVPV